MKRFLTAALALTFITLTACGDKSPTVTSDFNYKVGTASYTHTNDSYGYTEGRNGRGAVSTTLVAAVFDNDGNIVRISIDEVESEIGFDNAGQLADFSAGEVMSKKELGDAYGMKAVSSIGKEWHEQIAALEKWLEGRDVNTIIGGAAGDMSSMMDDNSINPYTSGATGLPDGTSDITDGTNSGMGAASGANSMSGTNSGINSNSASGTNSVMNNSGGMMDGVMSGVNSVIDNMTDGGENLTGSTAMNTMWMDEDLKASVTIDTTNIRRTIEKAYRNAK